MFFFAVMLSAWRGGLRAGLLATGLSVVAFDYYLSAADYSLAAPMASMPRLLVFALAALFVSLLGATQKRATQSLGKARDDLAGKVGELQKANQALQAENAERRRAEGLLRESKQRLRALVGSVDEIVFEFAADETCLNIWTRDESLLLRPRDELIGRRAHEVMDGGSTWRRSSGCWPADGPRPWNFRCSFRQDGDGSDRGSVRFPRRTVPGGR